MKNSFSVYENGLPKAAKCSCDKQYNTPK